MKNKTKNVLIIQRRMTEYRVPLFERLRESLIENGVTLEVVYGTPMHNEEMRQDEGILPWGTKVKCNYIQFNGYQLVYQAISPKILATQDLIIIPQENRMLYNYFLLARRIINQVPLAFWGHGVNFQTEKRNSYREKLKAWTSRHVDWWFAYTSMTVKTLAANGFPGDRITCLNNAIDTKQLMSWWETIQDEEISLLRESLGLKGKHVGIYLGGLHEDKRIDFLLSSAKKIREQIKDFELIIIGDGSEREKVDHFQSSRPWAHWVGARHGREKMAFLKMGQVILNPGMVGLNILDSFASGIPLITTDCGIHSPEIAYLDNGKNGIMTSDNLEAYVEAVVRIFQDDSLRQQMSSACFVDSQKYTLEKMVENFSHGILQALQYEAMRR